jgi:hypothetical protein
LHAFAPFFLPIVWSETLPDKRPPGLFYGFFTAPLCFFLFARRQCSSLSHCPARLALLFLASFCKHVRRLFQFAAPAVNAPCFDSFSRRCFPLACFAKQACSPFTNRRACLFLCSFLKCAFS